VHQIQRFSQRPVGEFVDSARRDRFFALRPTLDVRALCVATLRRVKPTALALVLAAALALAPRPAAAYTQWSAAVSLGGGGRLLPDPRREGLVLAGLRVDALFGPRAIGVARVGPFASAYTLDFDALAVSAGVSVLAPISTTTPLVFSAGATWDLLGAPPDVVPLGLLGRVWWGSRSTNLHASYGMAAGIWLEARWSPDGGAVDVLAGIDGDLAFLALPGVLLWNWITR
jgi:hypothetical protein